MINIPKQLWYVINPNRSNDLVYMTYYEKNAAFEKRKATGLSWAWYPVQLSDRSWRWLEYVTIDYGVYKVSQHSDELRQFSGYPIYKECEDK